MTKEQKSEKSAESRREIQEVVVIDNTVEADEEDEDASSTPMKPVNVKRTVFNKKIEDVDEDEEDDSENDYFSTTSFESGNISSDSEGITLLLIPDKFLQKPFTKVKICKYLHSIPTSFLILAGKKTRQITAVHIIMNIKEIKV